MYNVNVFRFHSTNTANVFQCIICESKKGSSVCVICEGEKRRDEERDGCPICWHSDPAGIWGASGCLMSLSYPRELTPLLPLESLI